jgi:large subunit ribosomal protein L33
LGKVRREIMAKAKAKNIELIALKCSECNRKNYTTQKNKRNSQGKIEFRKYCKFDKKHTLHKETKIK